MKLLFLKFGDLPLSKKLFTCLVLFFIIPLLLAALIINLKVSSVIINNVSETNLEVLKQTRTGIVNMIKDTKYLSLILLSDETLQGMILDYMRKTYGNGEEEIERKKIGLNNSIQFLLDSRPYISSICVSRG